ncbi:MAG: asparagine synthase-related protein [archaeon]
MDVKEALLKAVEKNATEKTGIAFSGGIDSTLLALTCEKLGKKFTLYTTGLQGSQDIEWATKIAIAKEWPLKIKVITSQEAVEIISEVVNILRTDDPVQVGVGCLTYSVLHFAKENKSKTVFSGLGADETFAGYDSHHKALEKNKVHEECERRLKGISKDVERDEKIAVSIGIEIRTPFLDEKLVEAAMKIKPEEKINSEQKKIILRKIAVELGLSEELAERPKKAAQYGSGFDAAMEKLAKQNECKTKKEYLASLLSDELKP